MVKEKIRFDILTIFPDFFKNPLKSSLLGKAINTNLIAVNIYNIRDFGVGKHKKVDDRPFGGGPGMVLKPDVLANSLNFMLKSVETKRSYIVMLDPTGTPLNQEKLQQLAKKRRVTLVCGHYEGVDQRFKEKYVDEEISIGDYILSGGEPAALVLIDGVSRLIPGFLNKKESTQEESFREVEIKGKKLKLLDHPVYTRPEIFEGERVPETLLKGDHSKIKDWRLEQSLKRTRSKRPDLNK